MEAIELFSIRASYKRLLREFFNERNFLEACTPLLVKNPGLEPNIKYFETQFNPQMGQGHSDKLYLITSPEYHLKKILGLGAEKIFEITRSFRNGELGVEHSPEFEMLEWYRQKATYKDIAQDMEDLLRFLWPHFQNSSFCTVEHYRVQDLYKEWVGVDLIEAQQEPLADFAKKLEVLGVQTSATDTFEDLFHRSFLELIEAKMKKDTLYFLWDFPASMRALSKLTEDGLFCKRFELYWGSIELGNAFDELIDIAELKKVCLSDREKRKIKHQGQSPDLDKAFIEAHERIHSQTGGIAVGLDRILQFLLQKEKLSDVMLFEVMRS
jgi:lysyl-tRNA synthetase class 2